MFQDSCLMCRKSFLYSTFIYSLKISYTHTFYFDTSLRHPLPTYPRTHQFIFLSTSYVLTVLSSQNPLRADQFSVSSSIPINIIIKKVIWQHDHLAQHTLECPSRAYDLPVKGIWPILWYQTRNFSCGPHLMSKRNVVGYLTTAMALLHQWSHLTWKISTVAFRV